MLEMKMEVEKIYTQHLMTNIKYTNINTVLMVCPHRSRRMFGVVLGTLKKFKNDEAKQKDKVNSLFTFCIVWLW